MFCAGIDAGSRAIKIVLVDQQTREVLGYGMTDQGVSQNEIAMKLLDEVIADSGVSRDNLGCVIGTGYGRDSIELVTETVTEITCHACGVVHLYPDCRTIIDIGGQDSKLIRLKEDGRVRDFVMNDRCAAGTGRFLEVVADRLHLPLEEFGQMATAAENPSAISSMCVVFAETEITGLLASGERQENIIAGVQVSIATRLSSMAGRGAQQPVVFTGGVSLVPGMKQAVETALKCDISIAENPRFTGALGGALIAADTTSS